MLYFDMIKISRNSVSERIYAFVFFRFADNRTVEGFKKWNMSWLIKQGMCTYVLRSRLVMPDLKVHFGTYICQFISLLSK